MMPRRDELSAPAKAALGTDLAPASPELCSATKAGARDDPIGADNTPARDENQRRVTIAAVLPLT